MAKAFASQGDMTEKNISFTEIGRDLWAFTAEGDPNTGVIIGDDSVILADFKTGIAHDDAPPETYQRQMALYAALIAEIFPDKSIVCWLIWTETARLQEITDSMRAEALARIFGGTETSL